MASLKIKVLDPTSVWSSQEHKIRKFTYGQPAEPSASASTEKVLMLVGGTGVGKSTLINAFVNYIMGVKYEDDFRYKLIDVESQSSTAYSQTGWITAYTVNQEDYPVLPYTFTIIDTPGYGEKGLQRDREITKQIYQFFSLEGSQGIDHLDGIGFVVQNANTKLMVAQDYLFDSILTIFGKDLRDNIFMMITFADANPPPALWTIKEAKIHYQAYSKFNNLALFPADTTNKKGHKINAILWEMGEESFESFFKSFSDAKSAKLFQTIEVLDEREQLQCIVEGLEENIKNDLRLIEKVKVETKVMKNHEADLLRNKNFTFEVEVIKQRQIKLPRGVFATNCIQCNRTCHYPCSNLDGKSNPKLTDKELDRHGYCKVCSGGKCHWTKHHNQTFRFEFYTVKEKKTSAELKNKYEKALTSKAAIDKSIKEMKEKFGKIRDEVLTHITEARKKIERLQDIALRPEKKSEIDYINLLIEKEKSEAEPGFLERIYELEKLRKQAVILRKITDEKEREEHLKKVGENASSDLLGEYLRLFTAIL